MVIPHSYVCLPKGRHQVCKKKPTSICDRFSLGDRNNLNSFVTRECGCLWLIPTKTGIMSRHIPWSHERWMILRGQKHQNLVAYHRRTIPRETCQWRVPWPWDSYGLPTTNTRDKRRVAQLLPCNLLENTYWMWGKSAWVASLPFLHSGNRGWRITPLPRILVDPGAPMDINMPGGYRLSP